MNATGVRVVDYARGARGRIFDLPPSYLDTIAVVVRSLHPKTCTRRMQKLMASGDYVGSEHPLIRGLDSDELRAFHKTLRAKGVTRGAG